jgi:hypothetical protein
MDDPGVDETLSEVVSRVDETVKREIRSFVIATSAMSTFAGC